MLSYSARCKNTKYLPTEWESTSNDRKVQISTLPGARTLSNVRDDDDCGHLLDGLHPRHDGQTSRQASSCKNEASLSAPTKLGSLNIERLYRITAVLLVAAILNEFSFQSFHWPK